MATKLPKICSNALTGTLIAREYIQSLRVIIIMIIMITISTRDEGEFLRQSLSLFILSVTLGYDNIESNALSQEESAITLSYIRLCLNFFIISFSLSLSLRAHVIRRNRA